MASVNLFHACNNVCSERLHKHKSAGDRKPRPVHFHARSSRHVVNIELIATRTFITSPRYDRRLNDSYQCFIFNLRFDANLPIVDEYFPPIAVLYDPGSRLGLPRGSSFPVESTRLTSKGETSTRIGFWIFLARDYVDHGATFVSQCI